MGLNGNRYVRRGRRAYRWYCRKQEPKAWNRLNACSLFYTMNSWAPRYQASVWKSKKQSGGISVADPWRLTDSEVMRRSSYHVSTILETA